MKRMTGEKYYVVNDVFNDIKRCSEKELMKNDWKIIKSLWWLRFLFGFSLCFWIFQIFSFFK